MIAALVVLGAVFVVCEVLHFRQERELVRRLMTKDDTEYKNKYETKEKKELPVPPARAAMKRWKAGKRKDD